MIKMVRGPFHDPLLLTTNKHYAETMVGFLFTRPRPIIVYQ